MNYFRKTKFRESSLIFVALCVAIVYFTTSAISAEQDKDVQKLGDARVKEAVEEALNSTTTSTTTTITKQIPTGLVQGPITNVSITKSEEYGEIYQMLVGGVSVSFDSSALYLNGIKIEKYDFEQGDYVVAVLVGPMLLSDPGQSAASEIHILKNN